MLFNKPTMKSITLGFCTVLLLGVASGLSAQTPRDKVIEFLDQTGIAEQLNDIPFIINEQFRTEAYKFQPEIQAEIKSQLRASFVAELVREDAISYVLNDVEQGHIQVVLDWLNSPLTMKMNELEIQATTQESQAELASFVEKVEDGEVNQARLQTILDFDDLTQTTNSTVEYIAELYLALVQAMNPYVASEDKINSDETDAMKAMIVQEVYPQYKDVTVILNLYTYKDVSDEELNEYISFYKTPEGIWFTEVSSGIFKQVLSQATLRVREAQRFID
jgi:hypothetical protein